ncbi:MULTISPECIES: sugar isomerase domain-containing protein [unclassified Microbacterium]|uniref:sugar isomerase domain-containing protein n=1 Tax=unclassified Microbacterium TaxID=2609290 RepID=UPI001ACDC30D|nr:MULTISPECIES: SIS domain-containing protein [unclassified Microbacterium]MBN9156209.1 SIS domain-containing protein [Microbacterium sp.]MBS1896704.1 SIS domain-containing protein [Actinomycetota bacterium]MBS1899270.1 SIS domain-containing protein [Actinomycetota bacterium]
MSASPQDLLREAETRLERLAADAQDGRLDPAIELLVAALRDGGVIQAFGTGHSEAFAMEIAGRAGGLIPTNRIALRDIVLHGERSADVLTGSLEREPWVVDELMAVSPVTENDVFVIASNSGVNGSIVGVALWAKEHGHKVIAVTSLEHTARVEPKHPSGKRLSEIADVVIDNLAPYGDSTLQVTDTISAGAISSITAAFIAQLLTLGVARTLAEAGEVPPMYISANIPGGDEHNSALEARYLDRLRRGA